MEFDTRYHPPPPPYLSMLFCRKILVERLLLASIMTFFSYNDIDFGGKGEDGKISTCPVIFVQDCT